VSAASGKLRRAAVALLAVVSLAGCGEPEIVEETVGRGPQAATIIRPDKDGPQPVVLFLHG